PRGRLRAKASLGSVGLDVAVGFTVEDKATGGGGRSAAVADAIRRLLLPDDLVGVAADSGKRPAHRRADRRRLGAADIGQPFFVRIAVAGKGNGPHRGDDGAIAGFRTQ